MTAMKILGRFNRAPLPIQYREFINGEEMGRIFFAKGRYADEVACARLDQSNYGSVYRAEAQSRLRSNKYPEPVRIHQYLYRQISRARIRVWYADVLMT